MSLLFPVDFNQLFRKKIQKITYHCRISEYFVFKFKTAKNKKN